MSTWSQAQKRFASSSDLGRVFRSSVLLSAGTAVGHLAAVVSLPIATRLYSPEELGLFGSVVAVTSIIGIASSLRYDTALLVAENDSEAKSLLKLCFQLTVAVSIVTGIVLFLLRNKFGTSIENDAVSFLVLGPLLVFGTGSVQACINYSLRLHQMRRIASARASQGLTLVPAQIALFPLGLPGLIVGRLVSDFATLLSLLFSSNTLSTIFRRHHSEKGKAVAARYFRFPLYALPGCIANTAGQMLPAVLIATTHGAEVAGYFVLSQKLISFPVSAAGMSISQGFTSVASKAARENRESLGPLHMKCSRLLLVLGIFSALTVYLFSRTAFSQVFGSNWSTAGAYCFYLTPTLIAQFVAVPLSHTLPLMERQGLQLMWDLARLTTICLVFAWASTFRWNGDLTVQLFSIASSFLYLLLWLLQRYSFKAHLVGRGVGSPVCSH